MILLVVLVTSSATLVGGMFALRLRDSLHLILGFSAGAVIAVAFFDLLPEALHLAGTVYTPDTILTFTALGFLSYLVVDRFILIHGHQHDHLEDAGRGYFSAAALSMHSFLDGLGIGLAFHLSTAVGLTVAAAVIAHDFSDGINTVNLVLKGNGTLKQALYWLLADAIAPAIGVIASLFIVVEDSLLGLILSVFAGFFLYLGASDLIPESHHAHPVRWTTVSTVLGAGILYVVIRLAAI